MSTTRYPFFLAGEAVENAATSRELTVTNKYTGEAFARMALADRDTINRAVDAAVHAASAMRRMPAYQRQAILQHIANRLRERQEEFAQMMALEVGKPIKDARGEVTRALDTLRVAAEEAVRVAGEVLPLEISQRAAGYEGFVKRVPIGPCSFITPFNFPLNLAAHKIAPAIAMGCPFILKPAPQAPVTAILLAQILAETDLPRLAPGAFSVLPCEVDDAAPLVEDDRIKLLSFTGSAAVGWMLKSRAGKKKVVLELGGNAACIVDRDTDLEAALPRIIFGAFYQSGQSCISVQRLLVHESLYDAFKPRLVEEAGKLKIGDPRDEATFLGPLISEKDVQRIHDWVQQAKHAGASILCGGEPIDRIFYPATILERVPHTTKLYCEEVFGPVLVIEPFDTFERACAAVNDSRYGLQAGVFTRDLNHALYAWNELEAGGVIINDVPSMRIDNMPYGGVKDSGLGREGVRYAMEEMSELRLMVVKPRA